MAEVTLQHPFASIRGALGKDGLVCYQRKYIINEQGDYALGKIIIRRKSKRDLKKNPYTEKEIKRTERFKEAQRQTIAELRDPERLAYWQKRFFAQTLTPEPGNTKCYIKFDSFIYAMIHKKLMLETEAAQSSQPTH